MSSKLTHNIYINGILLYFKNKIMKTKTKNWENLEYLGDNIIDEHFQGGLSEMNNKALEDLHPKLEVIKEKLETQLSFIGLYNNRLKLNPNNTIMADFIVFMEKGVDEINKQGIKAFNEG